MKNMTGAIYVAGALDYETRKRVSFELILKAIDSPDSRSFRKMFAKGAIRH